MFTGDNFISGRRGNTRERERETVIVDPLTVDQPPPIHLVSLSPLDRSSSLITFRNIRVVADQVAWVRGWHRGTVQAHAQYVSQYRKTLPSCPNFVSLNI
jgi:hypothetical protein